MTGPARRPISTQAWVCNSSESTRTPSWSKIARKPSLSEGTLLSSALSRIETGVTCRRLRRGGEESFLARYTAVGESSIGVRRQRRFDGSQQDVGDFAHGDVALIRVSDEHPAQRASQTGRVHGRPAWRVDRTDLVEHLEDIVAREGRCAGAQLVEKYPQREDVAGMGRGLAPYLFRREVPWRAEEAAAGLG